MKLIVLALIFQFVILKRVLQVTKSLNRDKYPYYIMLMS